VNNLILGFDQWVEVQSDLTVLLAEEYDTLETEVDENGDKYYTFESQKRFNIYNDKAEEIMNRLGFRREEL